MNADPCDDLGLFWILLTKGVCHSEPLLDLLAAIEPQLGTELMRSAVGDLQRLVGGGMSLHLAMESRPDVFSRAHVALVEGGSRLGMLERALMVILEATFRCPTCGYNVIPNSRAEARESIAG